MNSLVHIVLVPDYNGGTPYPHVFDSWGTATLFAGRTKDSVLHTDIPVKTDGQARFSVLEDLSRSQHAREEEGSVGL